jgi:type I restriction-modification system DNA methylase subunit
MSFKRRVLSALGKDLLLEIGRGLELDVTTRMGVEELRDALAKSKRARLEAIVQESLPRNALKEICGAVGIDEIGKEKAALVERILAAGNGGGTTKHASTPYKIDAAAAAASSAREHGGAASQLHFTDSLGLDNVPAKPTKAKGKGKKGDRRRAGVPDSEAVIAGTLKAALQQFALGAAGGYTGRDAQLAFTTHLLECFGWADGRPDGAEIPRTFSIADAGQRVEREVALWWPERRTLMEVAAHDAVLDFAWKDLIRVCLQLEPVPQYVVLTNQRDLHLYDLARDREAPRLAIRIDDLPKYSEAFPFFTKEWKPGAVPKIVNVEKVSEEVADLVARLYRSVRAQHPERERDVIRFTLQCITAMFAEDIGLLPKNYFTSLLYDGAKSGDVERRLHELFTQMNARDLPAPRVVPYFNGGLFTDVATLPLGPAQVMALTKAAEANWTYVDPHIFGSVFQGIMDDAERHASGAHYTAHDDIMRVVGPTIVEPWRKRIQAATSLKELTDLRKELFAYRVLDPACGSGNFLYVAFRELYRLDTELLSRMREFPSTQGKLSWNGGISAANFFGIDINPFAVELAKVTLNIAKKIAFEERKAQAFALAGQVEMDIDPSLPLDNLDRNVLCADALFTEWPEVDAIVGNPPFLGGLKIRSELGADYLERLQASFPAVNGRADFCSFWFRRAHDRLRPDGRAGLVATNSIRDGNTREATTEYISLNGGTITNAVSSQPWPGESVVNVSMVNWVKGAAPGEPRRLIIDGTAYEPKSIPPSLQLTTDLGGAIELAANNLGTSQGLVLGTKEFQFDGSTARELSADPRSRKFIKPVAVGSHLLRGRLSVDPEYVVDMSRCESESEATQAGAAFEYLKKHVFKFVQEKADTADEEHYKEWLRAWWRPWRPRLDFLAEVEGLHRIIVSSVHAARPIFVFVSRRFFPTHSLQLFGFSDDYSFGIIQSTFHWQWVLGIGSKIKEDTRYTREVWRTFPWPQEPSHAQVVAVANAAKQLRATRNVLMRENDWSLRDLYQSAEGPGSHPLGDAQRSLDQAVAEAYGIPPDQDISEFLFELNQLLAEDEKQGRTIAGPGLPKGLDPDDPRWFSADCIEPPPLEP